MIAPPIGGVFDGSIYDVIARTAYAVGMWATVRASKSKADMTPEQALADIVSRLQHPVKWSFRNPVRAIGRLVRSR